MDRNLLRRAVAGSLITVALRKESVDRNRQNYECFKWIKVALRKESVDRNVDSVPILYFVSPSLSARRAWIEMLIDLVDSPVAKGRSPQGERG